MTPPGSGFPVSIKDVVNVAKLGSNTKGGIVVPISVIRILVNGPPGQSFNINLPPVILRKVVGRFTKTQEGSSREISGTVGFVSANETFQVPPAMANPSRQAAITVVIIHRVLDILRIISSPSHW